MKLTAPIHILKDKAKKLKRAQSLTMTEALDQVARSEGFNSWSLLQFKAGAYKPKTTEEILDYLHPGDLLIVGARPGFGKTLLTLQLLLKAIKAERTCFFFSLEYSLTKLSSKLEELDDQYLKHKSFLNLDVSDEICAEYIIGQTGNLVSAGSLIAVDYLQLLDQQRNKPELQQQIKTLKAYARQTGCILIFISQIDRAFEDQERNSPGLEDIKLPNPLDMKLFNKSIFLDKENTFS